MKKEFEEKYEVLLGMSTNVVESVIAKELGINTKLQVTKNEYSHHPSEVYFSLKEAVGYNETDKTMRNNKALCQLFKKVEMKIVCGYDEVVNAGYFQVEVEYDHTTGGSNGHRLMSFWIDFNTGEVKHISKDC